MARLLSWLTGGSAESDGSGKGSDLRVVFVASSLACLVGFALVVWQAGRSAPAPLLWAVACLVSGAAVGFLFGIPRILQDDRLADRPDGAGGPGGAGTPAGRPPYRQMVNT